MTTKMKLVYIAGPYRAESRAKIDLNIARARGLALDLVNVSCKQLNGEWYPLVPHTNTEHFDSMLPAVPDQYYLEGTLNLMLKCDAVLLTHPDADMRSVGTKGEVSVAKTCNIPVFRTLEEFLTYARQPGLQSNTR